MWRLTALHRFNEWQPIPNPPCIHWIVAELWQSTTVFHHRLMHTQKAALKYFQLHTKQFHISVGVLYDILHPVENKVTLFNILPDLAQILQWYIQSSQTWSLFHYKSSFQSLLQKVLKEAKKFPLYLPEIVLSLSSKHFHPLLPALPLSSLFANGQPPSSIHLKPGMA